MAIRLLATEVSPEAKPSTRPIALSLLLSSTVGSVAGLLVATGEEGAGVEAVGLLSVEPLEPQPASSVGIIVRARTPEIIFLWGYLSLVCYA